MIGDNEPSECGSNAEFKPRKRRRGRPVKVRDESGLVMSDEDWAPQYEAAEDITIGDVPLSRLGDW